MTSLHPAYVAQVIRLYLDDPDTPVVPSKVDWEIAADLFDRNVSLEVIRLAFKLALIRRRRRSSNEPLPPIRSLAYFRAVVLNLSAEETQPAYVEYIDRLYDQTLKNPASLNTAL
ncbi:MAG: hypothetical protein GY856_47385 [bacterium]|nr:hypothetical protein [bacterium]